MGHLPEDTRTTFADSGKEDCRSETMRRGAEKEHRQPVRDTRFSRTRVFDRGPSYTVTGEDSGAPEGISPDMPKNTFEKEAQVKVVSTTV